MVIKSATPWAMAKASAGHFPPVGESEREIERAKERVRETEKGG